MDRTGCKRFILYALALATGFFQVTVGSFSARADSSLGGATAAGEYLAPVPARTLAQVSVPDGDFDGNGTVDIADALMTLRTVVGLIVPSLEQRIRCDVSPLVAGGPQPDGAVDITDALTVLRKVIGLITWPDMIPPGVVTTSPGNGAMDVARNCTVSITFSEQVSPATVSPSTFSLKDSGNNPVSGNYSFSGATVALTPTVYLNPLAIYTVTVTSGVMDLTGTPLPGDVVVNFSTGTGPFTPPSQNLAGTYDLTHFTVTITQGSSIRTITEQDVTALSGTIRLGAGIWSQQISFIYQGQAAATDDNGTYTITALSPTEATIVLTSLNTGLTETQRFSISGNDIIGYSTGIYPDGSRFEETDTYTKVSDIW